jgi:isopentenyldiphosphate isomerase
MTHDAADAIIEKLKAQVEMFRETNRRMNRRVQLLEGWWQRRLEREANHRRLYMSLWFKDRISHPLNVKALEEAAYQRGYEDGHDARFKLPPRRANPRRIGEKK